MIFILILRLSILIDDGEFEQVLWHALCEKMGCQSRRHSPSSQSQPTVAMSTVEAG
jgi:hypothetical protein